MGLVLLELKLEIEQFRIFRVISKLKKKLFILLSKYLGYFVISIDLHFPESEEYDSVF